MDSGRSLAESNTLAKQLGEVLLTKGYKLALAESCTGGLLAKTVTDLPGCSSWFDRGFVVYSNQAKIDCLGVNKNNLDKYGAVSDEIAREMAMGAVENSQAQLAISTTGIAGPGGGSDEKPVGLVWFGFNLTNSKTVTQKKIFTGDREQIRNLAVNYALTFALNLFSKS